jgi:hypothetical protein
MVGSMRLNTRVSVMQTIDYGMANIESINLPARAVVRQTLQSDCSDKAVICTWESFTPKPANLVKVKWTAGDIRAEESGRLIRLSRFTYLSENHARRAIACSSAHSRFVAMHRTQKRKIGLFKGMADHATLMGSKAKAKLPDLKKELRTVALFLKMSRKPKTVLKWKEKVQKVTNKIKRIEKQIKRWTADAGF